MKLLYLHPKAWSGEYAVLAHLRAMGHEVCVLEEMRRRGERARALTLDFSSADDGMRTLWYDPHRDWKKLLTWPLDRVFRRAFEGRNLVHRMWVIRDAVRIFEPDFILCTDGFSYAIPAAFLKRLGLLRTPLLASYIGGDILDCPEAGVGKRRTPMVSWLIQNSVKGIDLLRPLCRSLADILIEEGADPARIRVIPIQLTAPLAELEAVRRDRAAVAARLRSRYGISDAAPLVVTLSGNHKGKGLHLLAAQWPRIAAAVPGVRWLLCGPHDPWLDEAVFPALEGAGLAATVTRTGTLTGREVFDHLACADLHVNPTLCEGLNMVTVEAAAVGTPTITSDAAGISDWVMRLDCGLVVPARSAEALGEAVIAAFSAAERRLTWRIRCPTMAADFTIDRVAEALLALMTSSAAHAPA